MMDKNKGAKPDPKKAQPGAKAQTSSAQKPAGKDGKPKSERPKF